MKKAVVVVPTYNEKGSIKKVIGQILAQQEKLPDFELEVLVSDSHSPDGTGKIVKELEKKDPKVHYLDVVQRGIGVGLIKGHEYAIQKLGADVLVQMDADGQHNPDDVPRFLKEIKKGYNFVFGSRLTPGGKNQIEWYRQIFSFGSSIICRILTGLFAVHDFTPSFRAFTKEIFSKIDKNKIPWQAKSFIIQPSFLYEAITAGAKYKEIPIVFTPRRAGYSKNQIIAYILDILRFGLKVRLEKSKTFLKVCVVGTVGAGIQFTIFNLLRLALPPEYATVIGVEMAIVSNFTLNNFWSFRERRIPFWDLKRLLPKFLQFNFFALGAILIQFSVMKFGVKIFGRGFLLENFFLALGILLGLIWNYTMYSRIIWKK